MLIHRYFVFDMLEVFFAGDRIVRKRRFDNSTGGTLLEPKKLMWAFFWFLGLEIGIFVKLFGLATVYKFRNNRCGLQSFNCYTTGHSSWKAD